MLRVYSSLGHPLNKNLSDHPQIRQGKQSVQLRSILEQPVVTGLRVDDLTLDHPKRSLELAMRTGLDFLTFSVNSLKCVFSAHAESLTHDHLSLDPVF
jgi:hypothetical protein